MIGTQQRTDGKKKEREREREREREGQHRNKRVIREKKKKKKRKTEREQVEGSIEQGRREEPRGMSSENENPWRKMLPT